MKSYQYQIYSPSGNDTALVIGTEYSLVEVRMINDSIMAEHSNVEQVGFVSHDKKQTVFFMAGGRFCGNGTRSAIWYYLDGGPGSIKISIPSVVSNLTGGIDHKQNAWTEVPLPKENCITITEKGYYLVKLLGVSHLVLDPQQSIPFIKEKDLLLTISKSLLHAHGLLQLSSCGVIYTELLENGLRIHPYVHDYGMDTMIYETACGSGTIATAIVKSVLEQKGSSYDIIQPSGKRLVASIDYKSGSITKAIISGKVDFDRQTHYRIIQ